MRSRTIQVRWLMVVVAVVGLFMGLGRVAAVARRREKAAEFHTLAARFRQQAADPTIDHAVSALYRRDAVQMDEIGLRFDRAARRPWSFSEPKLPFPR